MEKLGAVGRKIKTSLDQLSQKSLAVVLAAHDVSGKEKTPRAQASYRYFLDVVLARPAIAFVDSHQRLAKLENIGLNESAIASLVLLHFILDHSVPNLVIATAYPVIDHLTNLPVGITAAYTFLAGRIAYGSTLGLAREIFYSRLPDPPIDPSS
ncbi:MAG: hypothetical protein ABII80_01035 [bacterium]